MVSLLTLTGGASLASILMYQGVRRKKGASAWWKTSWETVRQALTLPRSQVAQPQGQPITTLAAELTVTDVAPAHDPASPYAFRTAALAFGVSAIGGLISPPLQVAGMPLLVFMGLPAAQAAYTQVELDGRPTRSLVETVALVVCLSSGYYTFGALGFCLYHGGRYYLAAQQPHTVEQRRSAPPSDWVAPSTSHLWREGITCTMATATLQPGDHILLQSGEIAPIRGLITEGEAWLQPQALSATACALHKRAGDLVNIQDLVVVGRICVRVLLQP